MPEKNLRDIIDSIYIEVVADANKHGNTTNPYIEGLSEEEVNSLNVICKNAENRKAVLAVLVTSLTYKIFKPKQDIRKHMKKIPGGYSGRSSDKDYITPFLREMGFPYMISGSGWLTRSFEQSSPYNLDYPGEITPEEAKAAFLYLLDMVETSGGSVYAYLKYTICELIALRERDRMALARPSYLPIKKIIRILGLHFYSSYPVTGAARLPVLAIYSVYQCIVEEMARYSDKELLLLKEHTSADMKSGAIGDIERIDSEGILFEAVEIKHDKKITLEIINEAYEKLKSQPLERYYILSTAGIDNDNEKELYKRIEEIKNLHGCQVIINGIIPSLGYYFRLLRNPDQFIGKYVGNLESDNVVKYQHKEKWNEIISGKDSAE